MQLILSIDCDVVLLKACVRQNAVHNPGYNHAVKQYRY